MAKKKARHSAETPLFEVRSSKIHGAGVFAVRSIKKGARIVEYVGERITSEEADERYDDEAMPEHHTFLFALSDGVVIDATNGGNDAKYFNHSCEPNCEAIEEDGRIFIEAIKSLGAGMELVYDYRYTLGEPEGADYDEETKARYPCRCGSTKCRGTILAPPKKKKKRAKKSA